MANEIVKVYYPDQEGNTQFAYCETRGNFNQFIENINSFVGRLDMVENSFMEGNAMQRYRMYWVDEDNDKVLINSDYSLRIFLTKTNGLKKVFVVEKDNPTTPTKSAQEQQQPKPQEKQPQQQQPSPSRTTPRNSNAENAQSSAVHAGVQCDGCDAIPIIGFRYKCAQCYDYDLCEKCEQRKIHGDHVMYRFPVPLPRHTELNRRFFKKLRHSVNRGSDGDCAERPRKCGRRRNYEGFNANANAGGAANAFTNFYTMMCDLAEGMDHEDVSNAANSNQREPEVQKAQNANVSTEAPRGGSDQNAPQNSKTAGECPFVLPGINPTYAKASVQALKGFSEILGKFLDPLGITVEVDVGVKGEKEGKNADDKSASKAATPEKEAEPVNVTNDQTAPSAPVASDADAPIIDLTSSVSTCASATSSIAGEDIQKNKSSSSIVSNDGIRVFPSENTVPIPTAPKQSLNEMEVDLDGASVASKESETDGATKKRGSSPIEASWTLIGKQFDELEINEPSGSEKQAEIISISSSKAHASTTANAEATSMPSGEMNFAQLSKDLLSHIQAEERSKQAEKEQPNPKAAALVIHHPDKKINNAVIAMMSMGFSNEGGWLTNLLASVDGDLPAALELLHPSR